MHPLDSRRSGATRRRLRAAASATLLAAALATAGVGAAEARPPLTIDAFGDCEVASFLAALGPDSCAGDGRTTFDAFAAEIARTGRAAQWRFSRRVVEVRAGRAILVRNRDGEFHTFTRVDAFVGSCIAAVNDALRTTKPDAVCGPDVQPAVPREFTRSGVFPGKTLKVGGLKRGLHRFQDLVYPWMRVTVRVR